MRYALRASALLAALATTAPTVAPEPPTFVPHFRLLEPTSWIIENERGDPQKAGPCGGSNTDWGTESYVINQAIGGHPLHIAVQETIYHPGHYRVALAVNSPTELPADPVTETRQGERGPISVSAEIMDPVAPPVLVDGLWQHDTRPTEMATYEADIRLPNIDCDKCILQVVQWMNEHGFNNPGGYTYHHCAMVRITADPAMPLDTGWPEQR